MDRLEEANIRHKNIQIGISELEGLKIPGQLLSDQRDTLEEISQILKPLGIPTGIHLN